jgi:glycosyltransferase involved in cell wall biosynthesis
MQLRMKHNVTIFVDCHVFDKGFQGTRTYIQGLYLELIKDTTKHFYFAANDIENLQSIFGIQDNISYLKYNSKNPILRLLIIIPLLIRKYKIDFAHFQYRVPPIKCCKYIVTTHDVLFQDFPQYFPKINKIQSYYTYKFSARISDVVFTVSKYSQERIIKHLNINNLVVMPNGVDKHFFETYNKQDIQKTVKEKYGIDKYIIYVSRWEPRKNHHLVLKYFIELKLFQQYNLVFIGNDTFKNKKYEKHFNQLSPEIKLKIKSFKKINFDEMLQLVRGATISVYPSIAEGFGIPPLESIAAGIPTLCSNASAMSDFDFLEEYSFNPLNKDEFVDKLTKIVAEGDLKINEKTKKVQERYSWTQAAIVYNNTLNPFIDSLP